MEVEEEFALVWFYFRQKLLFFNMHLFKIKNNKNSKFCGYPIEPKGLVLYYGPYYLMRPQRVNYDRY